MAKISELINDDKNFNKGTETGSKLMSKSLKKFGAARSIVLDKNNRIIAGNKTIEAAKKAGLKEVQIIESDGSKIIAVKRVDIDLDSKKGRELALADNAAAKANIEFDVELIETKMLDCEAWAIEPTKSNTVYSNNGEDEDDEQEPEDNSINTSPKEKPDETKTYTENKYPLSIVLTKPQMMEFDEVKEFFEISEDTTAFLKMINYIKQQNLL